MTEEADAPLLTVDAVVRGVQRRSGDVDEIVRLSGDEVRARCRCRDASVSCVGRFTQDDRDRDTAERRRRASRRAARR